MAHVTVEDVNTRKVYTVGGSPQTAFTIPFTFYEDANIKVYNGSTLVSSNDYTIAGNAGTDGGYEGGTVTLDVAVSNTNITILLDIAVERTADFPQSADFNIPALNTQLDKITSILQKHNELLRRCLKLPVNSNITSGGQQISLELSEDPGDGKGLLYDATTKKFRNTTASLENLETYGETINANIADIVTVAENLDGGDTIGIVAAIDQEIQDIAGSLADLVDIAANLDDIINSTNNGQVVISLPAASGVSFTKGQIGYITSTGVVKANATQESTARSAGMVMATATINGGSTGVFLLRGILDGLVGLTAGANYYLNTTDGGYTTSQPYVSGSVVRSMGSAVDTDSFFFNPSPTYAVIESNNQYPPVIIESSSQGYEPNDGSLTINAPTDIETGDYLLLIVGADYTDGATATFTPPAGFTSLAAYTRTNTGAEGVAMQAFYKIAGSEPTTYTITENALQKFAAVMLRVSGADPSYAIDVQAIGSDHATEPSVPAVTTTVDETVSIVAITWDGSKTLTAGPSGYTAVQHVDQTGLDVYVAKKSNATAGSITAAAVDLSAADDWVGFHFVFRKQGATAGSGGSNVGPFPLGDDGLGYTTKLTLPVNEAGALSGATDAYEVFTSNSPSYDAGSPQLENYTHPIYFLRTPTYYQMASPIRPGAYTGSNTNGPARCEFRHERNYGTTERIRFKVTIELIQAAANSKCTCVQIHRTDASPVIKGIIQVDSGGTTWKFRTLVKKTDGAEDETVDKNGQDTNAKTGLNFNEDVTIEYDWTPGADLKIWVNKANNLTPDRWYENVLASGVTSYIKPGGPYPSNKGDGADSDLWIVRVKDFVLIDNSGNEVPRA